MREEHSWNGYISLMLSLFLHSTLSTHVQGKSPSSELISRRNKLSTFQGEPATSDIRNALDIIKNSQI